MHRFAPLVAVAVAMMTWPAAASAAGSPSITKLSPTSGPAGTAVVITGHHLLTTKTVAFAGHPALFTVLTSGKVRAIVPAAAVTGTVTLTTRSGSTESRAPFQVTTGLVTTPHYAGPGEQVAASGSGFPPDADVALQFDGNQVAQGRTNAQGGFEALDFTVPNTPFGPHDLVALSGAFAFPIQFLVETDWAYARHDVSGSGNDGAENALSTSNVGTLARHWAFTLAGTPEQPVEAGGVVYIGDVGGDVYAIDASTGTKKWMVTPSNDAGSAPAVDGNTVFIGDGFSLFALSTSNGKTKWSFSALGSVKSAPAVSSNAVYFTSYNGSSWALYSVNETNGSLNWTRPLSSNIPGSPALTSTDVYITDDSGTAYAVNRSTGKFDWKKTLGGPAAGEPDIANGEVYVVANGSSGHQVWDLNGGTGAKIWADDLTPAFSSLTYDNHTVFLNTSGGSSGGVLALNAGSGAQDWFTNIFGTETFSSPVVANGVVYADPYSNLVAFDEATGNPLWVSSETIMDGSPIVDNGQVLVPDTESGSNNLYAYGL